MGLMQVGDRLSTEKNKEDDRKSRARTYYKKLSKTQLVQSHPIPDLHQIITVSFSTALTIFRKLSPKYCLLLL